MLHLLEILQNFSLDVQHLFFPLAFQVATGARATISEDEVVEQMKTLSVHAGGKGNPRKKGLCNGVHPREL